VLHLTLNRGNCTRSLSRLMTHMDGTMNVHMAWCGVVVVASKTKPHLTMGVSTIPKNDSVDWRRAVTALTRTVVPSPLRAHAYILPRAAKQRAAAQEVHTPPCTPAHSEPGTPRRTEDQRVTVPYCKRSILFQCAWHLAARQRPFLCSSPGSPVPKASTFRGLTIQAWS
jgi:hypothetical protein